MDLVLHASFFLFSFRPATGGSSRRRHHHLMRPSVAGSSRHCFSRAKLCLALGAASAGSSGLARLRRRRRPRRTRLCPPGRRPYPHRFPVLVMQMQNGGFTVPTSAPALATTRSCKCRMGASSRCCQDLMQIVLLAWAGHSRWTDMVFLLTSHLWRTILGLVCVWAALKLLYSNISELCSKTMKMMFSL
ncbi:uncharacterized protein LOC124683128 isoform X2 [Lolium rigidum]|uniref:uncharacterized protein LOC124683128 isoform X2 n=1 Tax=Lolium rigidum TaxID=89674 RepID=UPI001F5CDC80|nr:uncharacterized protein LOC124683128 isoform X2 [Lolium rigidum]